MKQRFFLFFAAWILLLTPTWAQDDPVPAELCLSEDEMRLYTLIDNYRKGSQLHKIPLSAALSYVAKLHAMDLAHNRDSKETCSIHSWSGKADEWEACCFEKEDADKLDCMYKKPRELANYSGNGYEIITVGANTPEQAMTDWQENDSEYGKAILNLDDWKAFDWRRIGIAIYQNYTVVWFSEGEDPRPEPALCTEGSFIPEVSFLNETEESEEPPFTEEDIPEPERINEPIEVSVSGEGDLISLKPGYTYLIYGSYSNLENARTGRDQLKANGFQDVHIIEADANGMYRITIGEYNEEQTARDTKAGLQAGYENVWLLIN